LANGNTAIDGLSGNGNGAGSFAGSARNPGATR
jgi:hypothetical protein